MQMEIPTINMLLYTQKISMRAIHWLYIMTVQDTRLQEQNDLGVMCINIPIRQPIPINPPLRNVLRV